MTHGTNKSQLVEGPCISAISLQIILSYGDEKGRSFPRTEVVTNIASLEPDEIVDAGRKFAECMLQRCSGHFIEGFRQILLEQPRHFYYRP